MLLPAVANGGDEDQEPAYMIYIDPETGKYTTEDPDAVDSSATKVARRDETETHSSSPLTLLIIGAGAAIGLLAVGLTKYQRKLLR